MLITSTLILSLVLLFIVTKVKKAKKGIPILDFRIGTTDGFYYNVEFDKLKANIDSTERIRLTLGFITEVIRLCEKTKNKEKADTLKFLSEISKKELSQKSINHYFKKEFAFELWATEAKAEGKTISGTLYSVNDQKRHFIAKLPTNWFKFQFLFSIGSLVSLVVDQLSRDQRERFQKSLQYIANIYLNQIAKPGSKVNIANLENDAFNAGNKESGIKGISAVG